MTTKRTTRIGRAVALALAAALLALAPAGVLQAQDTTLQGVVNVNTASAEELQLLPGIGEARARALVETRKRLGGFQSVDQLLEVKGIGPTSLEKLRSHVAVEGKTTARLE